MHCDVTCLGNAFLTVSREVSRNSVQPCEVGLSATLNVALTTYDLPCVIEADFWLALWRSLRTSANNPICLEGCKEVCNMARFGRGRRYLVRDAKKTGVKQT